MTRKDFNLIANALRAAQPIDSDPDMEINRAQWNIWDKAVREMAVALRQTNDAFDMARFIRACEKEC